MKKIFKYFKKREYLLILILIAIILLIVKVTAKKENVTLPDTIQKPQGIIKAENLKPLSNYGQIINPEKVIIKINQTDFQNFPSTASSFALSPDTLSKNLTKNLNTSNIYDTNSRLAVYAGKLNLTKQPINSEEAQYLVKNKLISWNIIKSDAQTTIQGYNPIGFDLQPTSNLETAKVWKINLIESIDNIPLLGINTQNNIAEATLDNLGNLTDLSVYLIQPDTKSKQALQLKSYDQALRGILEGRIEIIKTINTVGEQFSPPPANRVKNISLEKVSLAYLVGINDQKTLAPYFVFEGNLDYLSGETIKAEMILSAIQN